MGGKGRVESDVSVSLDLLFMQLGGAAGVWVMFATHPCSLRRGGVWGTVRGGSGALSSLRACPVERVVEATLMVSSSCWELNWTGEACEVFASAESCDDECEMGGRRLAVVIEECVDVWSVM